MPEASGEALRFHLRTRARAACRCYCVFARFCGLFFGMSAQRTMSGQNMASESANVRSNPTLGARGSHCEARQDGHLGLDAFGTATEDSPDGHRKPGCSVWVFEIFRQRRSSATNRGCEYHFLAILGLGEAAGAGATRTMVPVVSESDGFTITLSDGVTPWTTSIVVPKSRPTLMS